MSIIKKHSQENLRTTQPSAKAKACRHRFLRFFPKGFYDEKYLSWERDYKWQAHEHWQESLNPVEYKSLLKKGDFLETSARALKIVSRTNLLFSFENMALRDAVRSEEGARVFAEGLDDFLHGKTKLETRFERWRDCVAALPKKQSRVLTHPVVTVFGFIAQPETHVYLKPMVTRRAAERYGFDFYYNSRPSWEVYSSLLEFAELIRRDLNDLKPRDMIDLQSFIWIQGSDEYKCT